MTWADWQKSVPLVGALAWCVGLEMLNAAAAPGGWNVSSDVESMPRAPAGDSRGRVKSSVSDELRMRTFWA